MNKYDRDNLQFIMSLNQEELNKWYDEISYDDSVYAMELLLQAQLELDVKVAETFDDVINTSEANSILKKFML
jgi:hypothetical protein